MGWWCRGSNFDREWGADLLIHFPKERLTEGVADVQPCTPQGVKDGLYFGEYAVILRLFEYPKGTETGDSLSFGLSARGTIVDQQRKTEFFCQHDRFPFSYPQIFRQPICIRRIGNG